MWKLVGFIFSFSIVPFFMGWFWHEKRKKNLVMNLEYFNLNKYVELVVFLMRGLL